MTFSIPWLEKLAWKQRFEHFCVASDLCSKTSKRQVAMLEYAMDEKTEDIFAFFKLSAADSKKVRHCFSKVRGLFYC